MSKYTERVKLQLDTFVDVFACADGGLGLVKYKMKMEQIAKQADDGDEKAIELVDRVEQVSRLVRFLSEVKSRADGG